MRKRKLLTLLAAAVVMLCLAAGSASAELIGFWDFDLGNATTGTGGIKDLATANGSHNGTLIGGSISTDVPTALFGGNSLDLTSGTSYVRIDTFLGAASDDDFNTGGALSVSVWVKGWPSGGWFGFVSKNGESGGWHLRRNASTANPTFTFRGTSGADDPASSQAVGPNPGWTHLAGTYDGSVRKLYVNGVETMSIADTGAITTTTDLVCFGGRFDGQTISNVMLDDIGIWDNALTPEEVQALVDGISPIAPAGTEVIYPKNREVVPSGEVPFSWINLDPNGVTETYVDVWFGTDPNKESENYTKIVNGESISSVALTPDGPGVYYWQIDSYTQGKPTTAGGTVDYSSGDPCMIEGSLYVFTNDGPIASVDLGPDMVTWSGEPVDLAAVVDDDGGSALTYSWTAGSLLSGATAVFNPSADVAAPSITITKPAYYSNANIVNAGFEAETLGEDGWGGSPGWTELGRMGNWNPPADAYDGSAVPEGVMCAWAQTNDGGLAQVLTETLAADTTYSLTVEVGNSNRYDWTGYKVQLLAGGTVIAEDNSSLHPTLGTFETSIVNYSYAPEDANKVGLPLEIRLLAGGLAPAYAECNFDAVELTADPPFPAPAGVVTVDVTATVKDVLNPAVSDTMTIEVYDDACQAARLGVGLGIQSDFNENCQVYPEDLATMAANWLNDEQNLDEPAVNPAERSPANIFSVSFYRFGAAMDTEEERAKLLLTEDDFAGYGDWLTNGWRNIECEWSPDGVDETPDTLTSTGGSTASFYFHDTRNGNNYNDNIGVMVEGANAEMMEGHGNGTLETPGLTDLIFHIELTDIPFTAYDLIFYLGTQEAQQGDGSGKYSLNDGPENDFQLRTGSIPGDQFRFDGTFEQVNKGDGIGNYILIEGVTGSSFDFKMHGTGFNHIGLSGFQVRENDPNAPVVSAGDNMITWEGEPVTLNATVDGTDSLWNMSDVTYSWTASPADDPKLDVAVSNPSDLETTVTITKVPYLDPYLHNGSFEIVTAAGGQAVQSYRDYWGQYDRPAGATVSARQYVNNPAYHFPDGAMPDGSIMLRSNSSTSESRPDGVAMLLGDVAYDPTATYELSVAVGRPHEDNPPNPNNYTDATWRGYLVQLVVGGQVESIGSGSDNIYGGTVVAVDANSIDIPRREWRTSVVTLAPSPELADLAGQPIQIRLLTPDDADPLYATQAKVFFDNVVLKINGEAGIYLIDPSVPTVNMTFTVEEVSTGNTASSSVSIDVYENPCDAAVAANPDMTFNLGDITEDCITNMSDLAILASEWLIDYTLTGAEPKPAE